MICIMTIRGSDHDCHTKDHRRCLVVQGKHGDAVRKYNKAMHYLDPDSFEAEGPGVSADEVTQLGHAFIPCLLNRYGCSLLTSLTCAYSQSGQPLWDRNGSFLHSVKQEEGIQATDYAPRLVS